MAKSMWQHVPLCLPVFLTLFAAVHSETCTTSSSYNSYNTKYCSSGCCGSYPYEYCCLYDDDDYYDYDDAGLLWAIVGGVLGSLFFVAVCIALICVAIKKQGYHGRVVQPLPQPTTVATTSFQTNSQPPVAYSGTSGQYPGGMPAAGPSYNYPPPTYT